MNWKWLDDILEAIVYGDKPVQKPVVIPQQLSPLIHPLMPKPIINPDVLRSNWDSQQNNFHNVRVLCDLAGLTLEEKDKICACIYQESQFWNYLPSGQPVENHNRLNGRIVSTDWGIAQINDYWHITKYPDFVSVESILKNPDRAIEFMITAYKAGTLKQWVSYSSGAYKQWLLPNSPMWKLRT